MSTSLFVRDAATRRLLDDGYDLSLEGNHLLVRQVPYVTPARVVAYGTLALPVTIAGDLMVDGSGDHRIWFCGDLPHDEHGLPLPGPSPESHAVTPELNASFMISSKPRSGTFIDVHDKVTSYVRVLGHPAMALDPNVQLAPGGSWQEVEDGLPFVYRDTATSRAGLANLNGEFRGRTIGIVGLGGTGSYILDQVAKTWVDRIVLFDGDVFDNHNAFRAPGAAALADLRQRRNKAEYFAEQYSRMRTGIVAHALYLDDGNIELLRECTFVFVAAGDAEARPEILRWLSEAHIPAIDVGMGLNEEPTGLAGLVRASLQVGGVGPSDHAPTAGKAANDYDRNIQTADLNALNAIMAVFLWKRHIGYYAASDVVTESMYATFTGEMRHETKQS
jgi:hypothetical protein